MAAIQNDVPPIRVRKCMLERQRTVRELMPEEVAALRQAAMSARILAVEFMDNRIFDLAVRVEADGDEALGATYRFIAGVLRPPIDTMASLDAQTNQFWVLPASLSNDEVTLLQHLVATVMDPELRARFADFLWHKTRDRQYGELAVDEYLASARRLRDPEHWTGCAGRYERAVTLAASLGKKNARYPRTIAVIEDYLAELNGTDPHFLSERLMAILLAQREGNRSHYAIVAEKCARGAEQRSDFYLAVHYWDLCVRWHAAANDSDGERQARLAAAESVVKDAESRTTGERASFLAAADFLRRGVVMLQKAGAPQDRIDELSVRLKDYQARSLQEITGHRTTFDATKMINAARAAVEGKDLPAAIDAFVALLHLPARDRVRQEVLRRAKKFVFSHLFGEIHLNHEGAAVAGRGTVKGDETEETTNVLALMYQDVVQDFSIQAQVTIGPAWRQIQDEHGIREHDMAMIAHQSWFVPPTRELFFAKGLFAGFTGDLMAAIHLLVPQMEAAIRWQLQQRRVTTTRPNRAGYHEERDLNQLLAMPESKQFLGDEAHFALTALLTSRFGFNLRNNLAHGLIEVRDCYSVVALYFWALVLFICVRSGLPADDEQ